MSTVVLIRDAARAEQGGRYFEIVREKPNCSTKECFTEYVVLPNGLAVKKQIDTPDETGVAAISVRMIADASPLFTATSAFFSGASASSSRASDPDNIFFFDGEKFYFYGSGNPDAEGYLTLFRKTDAAFTAAEAAPDFYVHVYYTPAKGNTKDFHVFSDGTVIASMFGKETYLIIYTFVTGTTAQEVAALRQLGAIAVQSPSAPYGKCAPAAGIDYAFVEIKIDGGYTRSYTCGNESNGVAALFNHVRKTFDDLSPPK